MSEPTEYPEPETSCDSCWHYEDIRDSWFGEVMYCHYHKKPRVNYHTCDEYENADMVEFPEADITTTQEER